MPNKLGNEFQVNTYTTNDQGYPTIVTLSNGNSVVVWQSFGQDGSSWRVYGQVFAAVGSKVGNEFLVNTVMTNAQGDPNIAALSNGNFVVVWHSDGQDGSGLGVYAQVFTAGGSK